MKIDLYEYSYMDKLINLAPLHVSNARTSKWALEGILLPLFKYTVNSFSNSW